MRVPRLLLATLLCLLPVAAAATPVTYTLVSGTVTATATLIPTSPPPFTVPILLNGSPSADISLTGTSFTFDEALVPAFPGTGDAVIGFQFVTAPSGPFTLSQTLSGVNTISLGALTVTTGSGFSSQVAGTAPEYGFQMGPIQVSGTATTNLGGPNPFTLVTTSSDGTVLVGLNEISVLGVTIGALNTAQGLLLIKGDFVFNGSNVNVPEPSVAALVLVGALVLAGARVRPS